MMFDINKLSTPQTAKTLNSPQGQMTKELTGTLAKLSSELKLIESLEFIKINSTRDVIFQQKPAQMLDVSTQSNKNFSLVNTQEKISINQGDKIELQINKSQQSATLNISSQTVKTTDSSPNKQNNSILLQPSQVSVQTTPQATNLQNTVTQIRNVFTSNPKQENNLIANQNTKNAGINNVQFNNNRNLDISNSASQNASQPPALANRSAFEHIQLSVTIVSKSIPLTVLSISTHSINNTNNTQPSEALPSTKLPLSVNAYTKNSTPLTADKVLKETLQSTSNTIDTQGKISTSVGSQTNSQINNQSQNRSIQVQTYFVDVTDGVETFTIQTRHRPELGSKIPVMVDNKGQLQLLPQEITNTQPRPVDEGLKVSLPKQLNLQEMTQFIKQLDTLSQSTQLGSEKLQQALVKLISTIPNLNTLTATPDALKQTLQQSGLFLENNLSKENAPITIDKDIKLNLLKLQAAASEITNIRLPQQFELVEKAIERITTNQLKHLVDTARNETQILPLQIEIPIKHGPNSSYVQFEVDREPEEQDKNNDERRRWLVKLKFDFPETGKIEARLSIQENKAGIIFVAENKDTERKIRSQLSEIRENLRKKDIELEKLDCFCAPLQSEQKPKITNRLIDVRT